MSEDIELGTSHLCTTEDAFEQFQAVSMYEEDEYITLADIVPPQPSVPDYGDLNQIPYDNEVILTTSNEPGEAIAKDTTGETEQPIQQDSIINNLDSSDNKYEGQSLDDSKQPQQPKRGGRNKKKIDENDLHAIIENSNRKDNSINNQHISIEKSSNIHNSGLSTETKHVRRGRPPKKLVSPEISTVMPAKAPTETTECSTASMVHNNPTSVHRKPGRQLESKYGRPRKISKISNEQLLSAADSTTLLSSEKSGSENDRINDNLYVKTTLRRRTAKKLSPEFVYDQALPIKGSLTIKNRDTNIDDKSMIISNKKTPPKRLRRNKVEEHLEIQEVDQAVSNSSVQFADNSLSNEPSTLGNDELDEISLSQLKHAAEDCTLPTIEHVENNLRTLSQNSDHDTNSDFVNKTPKKNGKRGRRKKTLEIPSKLSNKLETSQETLLNIKNQEEDETDDLCLSQLKEAIVIDAPAVEHKAIVDDAELNKENDNDTSVKHITTTPLISDIEYNIDGTATTTNEATINDPDQSLLVEDASKRPTRRVKQTLHYEQESDEDPFANMPSSSSDDEPVKGRNRKGNRYNSDEEYYPAGKRGKLSTDTETDSDINENFDDPIIQKKKVYRKKSDTQSPRKRGKKAETTTTSEVSKVDDIEDVLQSSVITTGVEHAKSLKAWGSSNEFENFLAKKIHGTDLKIKKVSSTEPSEKNIAPLEIPVINPDEKKTVEKCSQTTVVSTESTSVQTTTPFDIAMKENITLTKEQSKNACQFLTNIVKTTAELGQLMTEKSEDFIKKKIHTDNVIDTFKMDYCVRKSFLLFKLAKHNLLQMEEDLAKQYEDFLKSNELTYCREKQNELAGKPKPKKDNSDSDCEIVEEIKPATSNTSRQKHKKSNFNPKTVFLNKELSIKITKKPSEPQKPQKKIDIKGRHTVWINDTVMVKKVKPTQSFLAQDSRNKKPPDTFVTLEMVSDFFTKYYRRKVLIACAPFISTEWCKVSRECVCNYFEVKPTNLNVRTDYSNNEGHNLTNTTMSISVPDSNTLNGKLISNAITYPESLFKLCFQVLKNHLHGLNHIKKVDHYNSTSKVLIDKRDQPVRLLKLCLTVLIDQLVNDHNTKLVSSINMTDFSAPIIVTPLKTLCYKRLVDLGLNSNATFQEIQAEETQSTKCISIERESCISQNKNTIKSLFSLCVELIQNQQNVFHNDCTHLLVPNTLKHIAFENIKYLLYENSENKSKYLPICQIGNEVPIEGLTINSVNTLSEEAFLNLEQPIDFPESSNYSNDFENDDSNNCDDNNFEPDFIRPEQEVPDETNWLSQVRMQELRSFPFNTCEDVGIENQLNVTQIKLEPLDGTVENVAEPITVKTEPCIGLDEMTNIPTDVNTIKPEVTEDLIPRTIQRQNSSSSFDVEAFETFVRSNKLMYSEEYSNEDIFSQSASRVRRQHEPDLDEGHDMSMSLLVPQTYEPINIETAKGRLMESSSDESSQNKKAIDKKKPEKRKARLKKIKTVLPATVKDKVPNNEVSTLTRRMRDRIRQEEKKEESSDSENETLSRVLRNKKDNIEKPKNITPSKNIVVEIQCNNVDSTENMTADFKEQFTGFTAIDQNETSSYQKFMKFVYDKIVDKASEQQKTSDVPAENNKADDNIDVNIDLPIFEPNKSVELLECVPTMPVLNDIETKTLKKRKETKSKPVEVTAPEGVFFVERHGWKCYPIDNNDSKLLQVASINLEKLPDYFVQTYFRYQDVTYRNKDDAEVDRLTNLNTLKRNSNLKEPKITGKSKRDTRGDRTSEQNSELGSRAASPANSDHYDELIPSEDEGRDAGNELPTSAPKQTENVLAKDSLMNDNNSDSDGGIKVKQEPTCEPHRNTRASKNKPKALQNKEENTDPESLMLTADKVMNKELNLLHAPVVLNEDVQEDTSTKKPMTRSKQKNATSDQSTKTQSKSDEDSSSEEEKQWVNTKEKLLKRLGKKEDTSADDAKRAKLVTEFIERRTDHPESHKRRGRGVRSRMKFLEQQKQLKVLSNELYGETSADLVHNKRSAQAYFKGRRNIRKVIDKKSLARSTVIANMDEFERKRRLNAKQTKLREVLGCEEGVNVLVINDEVCLEYDFEECRPVVTIHPFFTKVMKAHQYEGVKFMWDACFESLAVLEAGRAGGGCILAHCMGLGKTLQVLALLHTVLTHPRVGMRRVLVCCPLSTVLNWVDEIHKWLGPVTNAIKVFELSKLKKTYERAYQLEDWYNGGGIFIIGYELFRSLSTLDPLLDDVRPTIVNKIRTALLDPGPDIIVCDEGHLLKNDCSVLAVAMSRVATKRRIVLTGTPMQNNLREYYCMVDFVKPNLLGTYAEFSNRFENPIMNGQHRDSREEDIKLMKARTHILHKVLEGCLQRQEASVLYPYLPKKHEYTVFIPLTPCQSDMYKHYLTTYCRLGKNGILKDFHILHKIWSHPQVLHNFQTKTTEDVRVKKVKLEDDLAAEDIEDIKPNETEMWWLPFTEDGKILDSLQASNKFMVVFKILEECIALGDKMLLFSTSLLCLDGLEYFLKKINKWSLGQEYYRLDGSVPAEVRQKWCREFNADNNEKTKLFLVSTRAGCLGLNMTAANRVVILDTSWNPAHDIQSIFRVYRFGQKKDCYIYRLVAMGTMEQKIYERSVTKQAVACRVVDEQQIDRHYNSADLTELYKYDEYGSSVACGVAVGVQDVVLLRVARAVALHAVHEHDSLLRGSEPALPEHERAALWHQFQQEQEDKQVQNKLIAMPKITLKRIHGHEYAKVPNIGPPVVKEEDGSADYVPPGPKSRKGKKIVKCCIPINSDQPALQTDLQPNLHSPNILKNSNKGVQHNAKNKPSTDEAVEILDHKNDNQRAGPSNSIPSVQIIGSKTVPRDEELEEEAMVQKISDILVNHNYQDKKMDIGTLISQVRRLVAKQKFEKNEIPDELSRSIAEVLLGEGRGPQPSVTDIMCESLSSVVQRPAPELITGDLTNKPGPRSKKTEVKDHAAKPNLSKTKRKAAIAAEITIDAIAQDVINLDDDDDDGISGDCEYRPDTPPVIDDPPPVHTSSTSTEYPASINSSVKKYNAKKNKSKPIIEKQKCTPVVTDVEVKEKTKKAVDSDSILLSDDDESPVIVPEADDEIVPLPSSLLTNKNFIKLVAHTYSAGNPMLDNDAATLAAQYSTFKALKESKETGKDIISGPIYDIAIDVLGKLTLKRLLTVNDNVKKSAEDTAALQFEENLQAFETNAQINSSVMTPAEPPKLVSIGQSQTEVPNVMKSLPSLTPFVSPGAKVQHTNDGRNIVRLVESKALLSSTTDTVSSIVTPGASNVVPVGLIKRGVPIYPNQQYAQPAAPADDECILPDDDVRIVPDSPPAAAPATTRQNIATFSRTSTKNTQPVILNHVLNKPRSNVYCPPRPDAETKQQPRIQIAMGKVVMPGNPPPSAARGHYTICLDSDDEDTATLPQPPQSTQTTTSKPMLLQNKLPQGAGQRKFVLVPASKVPAEVLKNIPETAKHVPENENQTDVRPQSLLHTATTSSAAKAAPRDTVASGSALNSKVVKTKCKPGDIFRISKNGQIEVLSKHDDVSVVAADADAKPAAAVQKATNAPSSILLKAAEPVARTISPSRSSNSLDDPLSILKDVVHIQAAAEDTLKDTPAPNDQKTVITKTVKSKHTSLQHVVSNDASSKATVASTSRSTKDNGNKVFKVGGDKNRSMSKSDKKSTSPVEKLLGNYIRTHELDAKSQKSGAVNKLYSNNTVGKEAAKSKTNTKLPEKGTSTKVVGNLKNIVLEGSRKCILVNTKKKTTSIDLTGGRSVQVTNIKKIPTSASIKIEAKKRPPTPAEASTSAVKKKRKPMTLKDFDLDDLDDIIELD